MTQRLIDIRPVDIKTGPTIVAMSGIKFLLLECSGQVDVSFQDGSGAEIGSAKGYKEGMGCTLSADFFKLVITSPIDQTIQVACAALGVEFNHVTGNVTASIAGATLLTDAAPVAVGTGGPTLLAASDVTRKTLVVRNNTTDVLALGGPAVTLVGAAIILEPGDEYELPFPQAAVYGIAAVAGNVAVLAGA